MAEGLTGGRSGRRQISKHPQLWCHEGCQVAAIALFSIERGDCGRYTDVDYGSSLQERVAIVTVELILEMEGLSG
jgi:hypothetical protein